MRNTDIVGRQVVNRALKEIGCDGVNWTKLVMDPVMGFHNDGAQCSVSTRTWQLQLTSHEIIVRDSLTTVHYGIISGTKIVISGVTCISIVIYYENMSVTYSYHPAMVYIFKSDQADPYHKGETLWEWDTQLPATLS